ncbi:MAG: hypothetical protein OEY28_14265, partial [Nitrospira sp.]|nr:hypothetical protein [Nitrospira sp.]
MSAAVKAAVQRELFAAREWERGTDDHIHWERDAWYWQNVPKKEDDRLRFLLVRWRADPISFAVEALRVALMPYQVQALLDFADAPAEVYAFYGADPTFPKRHVLLPSGHGLGKTRVVAVAEVWHRITHAFSKRIITAPTMDQIKGQLFGEITKLHRRLKSYWPALAAEWHIQSTGVAHANEDYGDWETVSRTARPDRPEALQGSHALDVDDEFGDLAEIFDDELFDH